MSTHGAEGHGGGHGKESGGNFVDVLSSPFEGVKTATAGLTQLFSGFVNSILSLFGGGGGSPAPAHH